MEPLTGIGLHRMAESAVAARIGWVVLNGDIDSLDDLRKVSQVPVFTVTRDHKEIGRIQGRQFAALLPMGGTVLYIQGPSSSAAAAQRSEGMQSTKPLNIQTKLLRSRWTEESATEAVVAWLRLTKSRPGGVDLIGCQYDGIAIGARKALTEQTNDDDREQWLKLPFTGVDGLPDEGQVFVNRGLLAATIVAPVTTPVAVETLFAAMTKGTQPEARIILDAKSYPPIDRLTARGARGH